MGNFIAKLKKIHFSKTFWFNIIAGSVEIADKLIGTNIVPDKILLEVIAAGNILLRFVTDKPLDQK